MILQSFGRKKSAIAIATATRGSSKILINGIPLELVHPNVLKYKILEPLFITNVSKMIPLTIKIYSKGGGQVSRIYAIRQALTRLILTYFSKCVSVQFKNFLKIKYMGFDKKLLINNVQSIESKKFGGPKARSRFQKSYR
mmetsp:Transcript_15075/g.21151  ORF Transcript_15075/g.21151 Transcript_15075/m.21151 type:complete len:140 (+) Transcript_15075:800-1219(+)